MAKRRRAEPPPAEPAEAAGEVGKDTPTTPAPEAKEDTPTTPAPEAKRNAPSTPEAGAIPALGEPENGTAPPAAGREPPGEHGSGAETAAAPPPAPAARPVWAGALIGAAIALAVVGAAAVLAWPIVEARLQARIDAAVAEAASGTETSLSALQRRLGALETRLGGLATKPELETASGALGARMAALEGRLTRIERTLPPADLADRVAALETRSRAEATPVAALDARLGAVEKALATQTAATGDRGSRLTGIAGRLDALEGRIATLDKRLAAVEGRAGASSRAPALTLAVAQLRAALADAAPFTAQLDAVRALIGDDAEAADAVATLAPLAETGVPTLAALKGRFSTLAPEIVRAAIAPPTGSWWQRTLARLAALVTFRRIGEVAGDSVEARVARAEHRLAEGDLAAAIAEVARLSGEPAVVAAPWLADARRRLAALGAVSTLEGRAAVALAGG